MAVHVNLNGNVLHHHFYIDGNTVIRLGTTMLCIYLT